MKDSEFVAKIKTLNFNSHGRTETQELKNLSGARITPTNKDPRFQTILPQGAAESRAHRNELIESAKEKLDLKVKNTPHKARRLHGTRTLGVYEVEKL